MSAKKQAHASPSPLMARYEQLVSGGIRDDTAQRGVIVQLQKLMDSLAGGKRSRLSSLLKKMPAPTRGLYIWGNVGRGKSMLMDVFYDAVPEPQKRRVHFHAFMQEVHARIHELRKKASGDPVALIAKQMAEEHKLLCFDELQATDVADATLLYRLFEGLFAGGVTIVSTSNRPPAQLYTGGVQRERFAKFIDLIEQHMQVVALSSPEDYRHLQMKDMQRVYFSPLGTEADGFIAQMLEQLCPGCAPKKETLSIQGRKLSFMLYDQNIGRFSFTELCESALGPADYLAIAERLDTLILTGIPALPAEKRNEAKRFVTLIDALYEHKVRLIATAATPPEGIYAHGDGSFEFHRTVSRLAEMQSVKYLAD